MKKLTLKHTTRNESAYHKDVVWENAQDLEHVACLHSNTNYSFKLIDWETDPDKQFLYKSLLFTVKRKLLGIFPITTFGFRKIKCKYEILQLEISPFLGLTSLLHSTLIEHPDDKSKTLMVDHITMKIPKILKPFIPFIPKMLDRHARIQCSQDEPFRKRRVEIHDRGIKLPLSIYNKSQLELLIEDYNSE